MLARSWDEKNEHFETRENLSDELSDDDLSDFKWRIPVIFDTLMEGNE